MIKPPHSDPPQASITPNSPVGSLRGTVVRHGELVSPDKDSWAATTTDPLWVSKR